ncbi:hypothetical protein GCM10010156_49470 [Planobispora rosea]|uniref:Uncharacterized protein n=1 Tax=Planobispora rosea TaxID=35762 RepID=A0A8J3SAV8_PLARO|nr:hypothetical protein [Planobispora rosea]GGS84960.1 hypothetical protein GCM10010156_49470 [Planobispora rosea]GIH86458.1 hypothetical protein Pro02_48660 [Planobispora rosea]
MHIPPVLTTRLTDLQEQLQHWKGAKDRAGEPFFDSRRLRREADLTIYSARRLIEAVDGLPAIDQPQGWSALKTPPSSATPPSPRHDGEELFRLTYTTPSGTIVQEMPGEGIEALAALLAAEHDVTNIRVQTTGGREVTDRFVSLGALHCPVCGGRRSVRYLHAEVDDQARYCCVSSEHQELEFFTARSLWRHPQPPKAPVADVSCDCPAGESTPRGEHDINCVSSWY